MLKMKLLLMLAMSICMVTSSSILTMEKSSSTVEKSPSSDLITSLPGLKKMTSFKQYSGYLDASDTKKFHYWFVESQNKPSSDPLVLWLNGGPGCSSLDGLLSENGPLLVNNDGETLRSNPWSWNKIANVLYLESPAGVGYSYDKNGDLDTGDKEVAQNNYNALVDFIKKFPQFADNEFYITGESYAGVYLPTLAVKLLESGKFNFKGMAVGNGLSSDELNQNSLVFFAYYHGLFGTELWGPLSEFCCGNNVTADNCQFPDPSVGGCVDAVEEAMQYVYHSGLNFYALYRDCYGGDNNAEAEGSLKRYAFDMKLVMENKKLNKTVDLKQMLKHLPQYPHPKKLMNSVGQVPDCINSTASTNYMNKKEVRDALHIPSDLPSWSVCSTDINTNYDREYDDMFAQYSTIMKRNNFRVLIYNGDTDMACNFIGDEWFVDRLNLEHALSRAPWYVDGQVAGFHKTFKSKQFTSKLRYTTIRGAGHMVPQWAPVKAYNMFEKFIKDQPF